MMVPPNSNAPKRASALRARLERGPFHIVNMTREQAEMLVQQSFKDARQGSRSQYLVAARLLWNALGAEVAARREEIRLRPKDDWHEDHGSVLWWKVPIDEPPYVGSPLDTDFPEYMTHWQPLVMPLLEDT